MQRVLVAIVALGALTSVLAQVRKGQLDGWGSGRGGCARYCSRSALTITTKEPVTPQQLRPAAALLSSSRTTHNTQALQLTRAPRAFPAPPRPSLAVCLNCRDSTRSQFPPTPHPNPNDAKAARRLPHV